MSLRKKACSSCVAAKRKCDSAFPACHRCAQRSLTCHYPYSLPRIFQDNQQNELGQEDMPRPNLVALRDLQTESTNVNPVTGLGYPQKSVFESQAHPILSDNLISSDESAADKLFIPSPTETLSGPGYDHSCNGTQWPVSFDRRILAFYPRVDDKKTWAFGVRTLLNQIDIFLRTGSAFFIHPQAPTQNNLLPPLRAAYGVCSSYKIRKESEFPFFQQLLESEIENLLALRSPDILQEQVAELCAMLLYYVLIHFGGTRQRGKLADKSETFLAQHTARVESLEFATRQSTATLIEAELLSNEEGLNLWHLCESARKVVMVSYLAREIRHVLRFRTCYLLRQIVALPVSEKLIFLPGNKYGTGDTMSAQWQDIVSYDRFVRDWEAGELDVADEFTYFLISMCKDIIKVAPYRIHQLCASTFTRGRCVLTGDAAHLNNPSGAMGLATGLLDVEALADSLELIINDGKPKSVLNVYSERQRVFQFFTNPVSTANKTRIVTDPEFAHDDWVIRTLNNNPTALRSYARQFVDMWRTGMTSVVL